VTSDLPGAGGINRPVVTISVMLATILQVLDTTIANVALPHMQASLGATRESVTWVLTSYIVASAVALPASGWLADRFGLKRMYLFSIASFVIASILCGLATSLAGMVFFRALQGAGGAALIPISQTIMLGIYPKERHGFAIALWGMAVMISPIAGPVLGGWLTDDFSWRWVFYVNVPIGLLALAGVLFAVPNWQQEPRRFDVLGFITLAVAILALQTLLDRGTLKDWFQSWEIIVEAAVAASAAWIFVVHMVGSRTRLFEPEMLKDRNYLTALFFTTLQAVLTIGGAALLPAMLQQLFGYSAMSAGLLMVPRGIGIFISMILVGRLLRFIDLRLFLFVGMSMVCVSLYQMTQFSLEMDKGPVVVSGLVQGLGLGLCIVPNNLLAFESIRPALRTDAAALYMVIRGLGGSVGVSSVTTILATQAQVSHSDLAANVTGSSVQGYDGSILTVAGQFLDQAVAMLDMEINRQALMIAYLDDYRFMMLGTICSLPLLLLIRRPSAKSNPQEVPVAME
jgi:DHA2 family multidrug resistance protein